MSWSGGHTNIQTRALPASLLLGLTPARCLCAGCSWDWPVGGPGRCLQVAVSFVGFQHLWICWLRLAKTRGLEITASFIHSSPWGGVVALDACCSLLCLTLPHGLFTFPITFPTFLNETHSVTNAQRGFCFPAVSCDSLSSGC